MLPYLFLTLICSQAPTVSHADLIRDLGSETFSVREAAQASLEKIGPAALPDLRIAKTSRDQEVARRAAWLVDAIVEKQLDEFEPFPFLDSLWYDRVAGEYNYGDGLLQNYYRYLALAGGPDNRPWDNYRLATRLLVKDWLANDSIPSPVLTWILEELHKRDEAYLRLHPPPEPDGGDFR